MIPKNILDSCREYLRVNHIFVNENWLTEAIEYFIKLFGKDEIQMIHIAVKKQWYGHDITKICPGSLPQNLKGLKKEVLNGHYMLQINSITSFEIFSQHKEFLRYHLNIKKRMERAAMQLDMLNLVDKMLQLYMTDGVQEVIGIVFKPIKDLYVNTVPGIKVLIKGPVLNCGGFLLLSNKNCQLLEGEVEDLMSENFDHTMNLMEIVHTNSVQTETSLDKNVNCSINQEIPVPVCANSGFNNTGLCLDYSLAGLTVLSRQPENDAIDLTICKDETETLEKTPTPSLIEISEKLKLVKSQIESWAIKRNYESSIGDALPGSSANNHNEFFVDEFETLRKKRKDYLIRDTRRESNVNGIGLVGILPPQNNVSGSRSPHHSTDDVDAKNIITISLISPKMYES